MNDAIIFAGLHATGKLAHVQTKVLGETFQPLCASAAFALVDVEVVVVLPESALLAGAFGGEGRQIRIVVDMRKVKIGEVYEPRFDVGLLDFQGRSTGPVLTAGSQEVAEIGDSYGGVERAQDVPFPGGGGSGGSCIGGGGVGRSGWGCEGVGGEGR